MSDEKTPIKATDLLVKLDDKISNSLKLLSNLDSNIKILLNRQNDIQDRLLELEKKFSKQLAIQAAPVVPSALPKAPQAQPSEEKGVLIKESESKFEQLKKDYGIEQDSEYSFEARNPNLVVNPQKGYGSEKLEEIAEDYMPHAQRRGARVSVDTKKSGSVAVSQVLHHPDDNAVLPFAQVKITNMQTAVSDHVRTNHKGRWTAPLKPGNYSIEVTKRYPPNSGKTDLEFNYDVQIQASDIPLEISTPLGSENK